MEEECQATLMLMKFQLLQWTSKRWWCLKELRKWQNSSTSLHNNLIFINSCNCSDPSQAKARTSYSDYFQIIRPRLSPRNFLSPSAKLGSQLNWKTFAFCLYLRNHSTGLTSLSFLKFPHLIQLASLKIVKARSFTVKQLQCFTLCANQPQNEDEEVKN